MELEGADAYVVEATVPLSSMFGYVTACATDVRARNIHDGIYAYAPILTMWRVLIIEARRDYVQTKRQ
jgi:urea transporter